MREEKGWAGLGCRAVAGRRAWRAFTLLELLAVIAIIAVLGGLALGAGRRAIESGNTARARTELASLAAALEAYRRACGDYPRTNDGTALLEALMGQRDSTGTSIAGRPFIETAKFMIADARLVDPWDQPYRYAYKTQSPWTNSSPVLWSVGPDGRDTGALLSGGYPDRDASANLDNIYASEH